MPVWLTPADQQLFVQGMDEFAVKGELPDDFAVLQQRYPDSPWAAKAQAIQALLETIQKQQKIIKGLKGSQTASSKQNQILLQQIETLETDLETLEVERTKLRQLLIDLEQRGR
ncbi:MAG: hypothetical protein BA869_11570 [Desulfuromonadales bacterium C00003107]|jgi:hypothetical protein|nr:MAG: hypothetical protein BA869_11570 [Desulfuromonadales bacterium C00003107]